MSCCPETITLIRTNLDGTQVYVNESGSEFPISGDILTQIVGGAGSQIYINEAGDSFPILIPDICTLLSGAVDGGYAVI